jgi:two-component system NtrC family response regulator
MQPPSSTAERFDLRILLLAPAERSETFEALRAQSGLEVEMAMPGSIFEEQIRRRLSDADAVLVDATAPVAEECAERLHKVLSGLLAHDRRLRPIALVPVDDPRVARAAASAQAWDVLTPAEGIEELVSRLRRAALLSRLEQSDCTSPARTPGLPLDGDTPRGVWGIVGSSGCMHELFERIDQVAGADVPVLLTGESGTGKELVAETIHRRSARRDGRLVPINCSAIPENLLEAELFGHEKGAFTGATRARPGRLEAAHQGTLFLDEVAELAPLLQVKLLRFLEDHVIERVGGRKRIALDVRVIAATNRDLARAVRDGTFREDLYYRLAVFDLELPPLRERSGDVLLLADFYLQRYASEAGRPGCGFSEEAREALTRHSWPGNVRELINRVRRALVVADGSKVTAKALGLDATEAREARIERLRDARRTAEVDCIRAALRRTGWNKAEAARMLDISRTHVYELIRRHEIPDPDPR